MSKEKSSNINLTQGNVKAENVTREREERPLIIVAGDSIAKGLKGIDFKGIEFNVKEGKC